MPKQIGTRLSKAFEEFKKQELELREDIIREINSLVEEAVIKNGALVRTQKHGIVIVDGPSRVSSWSDEVSEVVIGVAKNHVIIDENGEQSAIPFSKDIVDEVANISTETLVDVYNALEIEVDNGTEEVEDYSDLIKSYNLD